MMRRDRARKVRLQNDPTAPDPLVMDGFRAFDRELAGPDPVGRMQAAGEPAPSHGADTRTEGAVEVEIPPTPDVTAGVDIDLSGL